MFGSKPVDGAKAPALAAVSLDDAFQAVARQKTAANINDLATHLAAEILRRAVEAGASDVHFEPHGPHTLLRFRIDGHLMDQIAYPKDDFPVMARLRVMAGFSPKAATAYSPEDGRFDTTINGRSVQFRASAFPTIQGDKLVLRVLDLGHSAAALDRLGFAPDVLAQLERVIRSPSGIFFVAGLTGSGKSTTLSSVLQVLSRPEIHIMTLEDPVEYEVPRVNHSQINTKAGFTFAEGLKSMLRQDPDVIMVGEVRDLETADIALRAALTGHLIFTTIHATTAIGVVNRLISMGIEPYMVTNALIGTLAQRLVRMVCEQCAQPAQPDMSLIAGWTHILEPPQRQWVEAMVRRPGGNFRKGKGCAACRGTGYKGRIGVFELLVVNDALRALIFNKANIIELRQAVTNTGMKTLLMDALQKAWSGVTTLEEAGKAALQF